MRDGRSVKIEPLWSLRLQPNTITLNAEQLRHPRANRCSVRTDLRSRQDQARIEVGDRVSGVVHSLQRLPQKDHGVGAFPLRVRGRKQRSNVWRRNGSEQRVGNGVKQDVSIGVTAESMVVLESNAPDLQWNARAEFVGVKAVSNASRWLCGRWSSVVGRWHSLMRVALQSDSVLQKSSWLAAKMLATDSH